MLKFKNEIIEKAFQEGIYADTPANRKLGRVGMSYKEYSKKKKEKDEEEYINKLMEKSEVLKNLKGFKLDRVIKYTGFDIDLKKPESEKKKELAKKYFKSASLNELSSDIIEQGQYLDDILTDALEESIPYNVIPKKDFSKLNSTDLMKALSKKENWSSGALNINGKNYYKIEDKFYTQENDKKGLTKEELYEDVQKHLDSIIKTSGVEENLRKSKGINLTKQAFYTKPAYLVKKERVNACIEKDTDFDVLNNQNGKLNLIDRTKSDGKEFTFDMKDMSLSEVLKEIKGENGEKKKDKNSEKWTEESLSKELKKYPFKPSGGGVINMDTAFGGGQILKTDNKDNKYEVRTWNDKNEVSEPSHFNSLEECKNHILDTIIKNTVGKNK